jgi:hypothetical protein
MEHLAGEKVRKAIPKTRDKTVENHPSQKKAGRLRKSRVRERKTGKAEEGKKTEEPERFGEPRPCMRKAHLSGLLFFCY